MPKDKELTTKKKKLIDIANNGRKVSIGGVILRTSSHRDAMREIHKKYTESDIYKEMRKRIIEKAKDKCEICKIITTEYGAIHHKDYKNWGKGNYEEEEDCMYICRACHIREHKRNSNNEYVPFWAKRSYDELFHQTKENASRLFKNCL